MKKNIAYEWARALESGDYQQGRDQLRKENSFCCLGVLCNLHAQKHPEIARVQDDKSTYMNEDMELPEEVRDWAGMRDTEGKFTEGITVGNARGLTQLNDGDRIALNGVEQHDFKQIAKIIRKYYRDL